MKLVLYGGGHDFENRILDHELIKLAGKQANQMTFIPAESYMSHLDFSEVVEQYRPQGIQRFIHFPVDNPYTEVLKNEAFSSDIIYLSGGNTFSFLKSLRKAKLMGELKEFIKRGGILTGLSAGAILMTNNIATAGFPEFDRDENDVNVKNLKALNLVNFEFFPHYRNSKRYERALLDHSKRRAVPVYGCPDGTGIVINHEKTTFIGKIHCFYQGKKFLVKSPII